MYREMRRKDRELPEKQAMELLRAGEFGVLSTVSADGLPYGVPLSFALLGDRIYFHCAKSGHKVDNLSNQSNVSFCVVGSTQPVYDAGFTTLFESAIVHGTCTPVTEPEEHRAALRAISEKYLPQHMDRFGENMDKIGDVTAVYAIAIGHITGKRRKNRS